MPGGRKSGPTKTRPTRSPATASQPAAGEAAIPAAQITVPADTFSSPSVTPVALQRVHDRAGQDVRADLRAFLDNAYADLVSAFDGKLLQADRRSEAGGACAHHDYVILHRFTFSQFPTLFAPVTATTVQNVRMSRKFPVCS